MNKRILKWSFILILVVVVIVLSNVSMIASEIAMNHGNVLLTRALTRELVSPQLTWPFLSGVYLGLAPLNEQQKRLVTDASKHFVLSREFTPTNVRAWVGQARANAFLENLYQADSIYRRLVAQHYADTIVIEESAQVALLLDDRSRAITLWQSNGFPLGPYLAGLYLKEKQDWIQSEQQLLLAVQVQPENAVSHFYLCLEQKILGRTKENVLYHCQEAVRLEPQSVVKRIYLASLLAEAGNLSQAIEQAQIAVELKADPPIQASAYMTLGYLLAERGDTIGAIEALKQSIHLSPSTRAYYWLGIAYKRDGRTLEAINAWKQSLVLEPDYSPSLIEIEKSESGE